MKASVRPLKPLGNFPGIFGDVNSMRILKEEEKNKL
jgi:hypothetical protein